MSCIITADKTKDPKIKTTNQRSFHNENCCRMLFTSVLLQLVLQGEGLTETSQQYDHPHYEEYYDQSGLHVPTAAKADCSML